MTSEPTTASEPPSELRVAVAAALDRKAEDLKVLDLAEASDFTEYFLICSGTNERQVQAIADAIRDRNRDEGARPLHVEGYRHGRWILLDYGGFVAHIFEEETRDYYRLERLWADGRDVTAELSAPAAAATS